MIRVKASGAGAIADKLRDVKARIGDAVGVAMYEEAVEIMRDSTDRAPTSSGQLRDSAYVTEPDGAHVEAGYGVHYALVQHERTDLHHDDGESKFLQKAIDDRTPGMADRLTERAVELLEADAEGNAGGDFPTSPPPEIPRVKKGRRRSTRVRAAAARNRRR